MLCGSIVQEKLSFIVVSAGNLWAKEAVPEAQLIADLLIELGAPRSALILERDSGTTRENAVYTKLLFKKRAWRKGILVTSGAHMPRALAAFQMVGLDVIPAATDVHAVPSLALTLSSLLRDVRALARTTLEFSFRGEAVGRRLRRAMRRF